MITTGKDVIEMRNISIEFPGVKALSNADFTIESGTINALLGANGAGKSTLMKILSGAHDHYTGSIYLNDEEISIKNPKDAKEYGIEIVYQEVDTALIPYLSVGENIMMSDIVNHMEQEHVINWKIIHHKAREVLEELNIDLNTKAIVSELDLAQKQMVLIARAIVRSGKYLILDEPTAPLSGAETEELFKLVRQLAYEKNLGIIFISHRLPEVFEICENITIMKNGNVVSNNITSEMTTDHVVNNMLGEDYKKEVDKEILPIGKKILSITNLSDTNETVKNVNLKVHAGEVVGIAGLVGAGKTELLKTIFGSEAKENGEIILNGNLLDNKSTYHAVRNGFALVPEERRKEGILVEEAIYSNLTAASLSEYTRYKNVLRPNYEREVARSMINKIGIVTPDENQQVGLLSGGNQQKVAVGKWLMTDAEIYLLDEPTKGVDVGAKGEIFNLIYDLAKQKKGIIYATSELSEIMSITDRIYVMYDNEVVKELVTKETSEQELLYYSTGGT